MVVIPARAKLSLYCPILMESSHSGTDLNMVPSQPLVLGRRMDTLRETADTSLLITSFRMANRKTHTRQSVGNDSMFLLMEEDKFRGDFSSPTEEKHEQVKLSD